MKVLWVTTVEAFEFSVSEIQSHYQKLDSNILRFDSVSIKRKVRVENQGSFCSAVSALSEVFRERGHDSTL
jgi:hypothetical protein